MVMGKKMLSSVQSLSCVWLFATPRTAACQVSLSITNSQLLLKLMSIDMSRLLPSNHFILIYFFSLMIYTVILCLEASTSLFPGTSLLFLLAHSTGFLLLLLLFKSVFFLFKELTQLFLFSLCLSACGILVPCPGIKPVSPIMEVQSLNHWMARQVPHWVFKFIVSGQR